MRIALGLSMVAACSFKPGGAPPAVIDAPILPMIDAVPDAPPPPVHLHVEALIDGRSQLELTGPRMHWHHFQFAAPGRWNGATQATVLDTSMWQPVWPDVPTAENRDCNCVSSMGVLPNAIPLAPATVTLTPIQVRKSATVIQDPSATNAFTTIIELDDTGVSGAITYSVDLDIVPR